MNVLTFLVFIILQTPNPMQIEEPYIHFKKGACMGECPVYQIMVDHDGKLTFNGVRFTEKEGVYERMLTKKEFRNLKCKFKKSKLKKFEDNYGMDVMDASMSTLTINKKDYSKTIKSKIGTPEKLLKSEAYLISLTPQSTENSYEWKTIKTKKQDVPNGRKEMGAQEIILQLKPNVDIDIWIKKYNKFGVQLNKKLVPNRPVYLLRFDSKTTQLDILLKRLNSDPEVEVAEANKKVEMRK